MRKCLISPEDRGLDVISAGPLTLFARGLGSCLIGDSARSSLCFFLPSFHRRLVREGHFVTSPKNGVVILRQFQSFCYEFTFIIYILLINLPTLVTHLATSEFLSCMMSCCYFVTVHPPNVCQERGLGEEKRIAWGHQEMVTLLSPVSYTCLFNPPIS